MERFLAFRVKEINQSCVCETAASLQVVYNRKAAWLVRIRRDELQ
jgi:hypothetical protein